jgi:hypothetical protein
MRTKVHFLNFDEVQSSLRTLGFDVQPVPGVANQVMVRKYGAGAILIQAPVDKKTPESAVIWRERPGFMVAGEVATLLDKGYQKFWKASKIEVPATAESLQGVHRFSEELREIVGEPSLYNESLGTTSDSYMYDRVKGRDLPLAKRPVPAWKLPSGGK